MIPILPKLLIFALFTSTIFGCTAFLNEGATSIRSDLSDSEIDKTNFASVYFPPNDIENKIKAIKVGEAFSISLLSAHICGLRENLGPIEYITSRNDDSNTSLIAKKDRTTDGSARNTKGCLQSKFELPKSNRITRGEISIIVNVSEMSHGTVSIANSKKAESLGRVIYYADDVRESGQLINAINIPIYGPTLYRGKEMSFDLWLLELDNGENRNSKSLYSSLATLGGKAYPPSAPILGVLNTLGNTLLTGNQDDVEARFSLRFDPPAPPDSRVYRLPLAEGYYAFVREENRDINPRWSSFGISKKLGVLCNIDDNGQCLQDDPLSGKDQSTYRDRTWFLVRIASEKQEAASDIEYGEEVSKFLRRLSATDPKESTQTKAQLEILGKNLAKIIDPSNSQDDGKTIQGE